MNHVDSVNKYKVMHDKKMKGEITRIEETAMVMSVQVLIKLMGEGKFNEMIGERRAEERKQWKK